MKCATLFGYLTKLLSFFSEKRIHTPPLSLVIYSPRQAKMPVSVMSPPVYIFTKSELAYLIACVEMRYNIESVARPLYRYAKIDGADNAHQEILDRNPVVIPEPVFVKRIE